MISSDKIKDSINKLREIISAGKISSPVFGLDIGNFSVKTAEIKKSLPRKEAQISCATVEISKPYDNAAVVAAIKQCVKDSGITSERAQISLSGPNIIIRHIVLPKMQDKDLENSLEFELGKHIPQKLDNMVIDYQVVDKALENNQMAILVVGAERKLIEDKIDLVKKAGLSPQGINVDSFAVIASFGHANPDLMQKDSGAIALLDIGHKISKLTVLEDGTLRFSRDIMFGSHDLTKAISERIAIDLPAAEQLKRDPQDKIEEIERMIKAHLNSILDEVHISFDYCDRLLQNKISGLYLSGGGAKIGGIDNFIQPLLGIEVNFWNPLSKFKAPDSLAKEELEAKSSALAVAVGLAL